MLEDVLEFSISFSPYRIGSGNFFWGKLYKTGYRECFNMATFPFSTFQDVILNCTSKSKFLIKFEKFLTIISSNIFLSILLPFLLAFSLCMHWYTKRYPMFVYNTLPLNLFFFFVLQTGDHSSPVINCFFLL